MPTDRTIRLLLDTNIWLDYFVREPGFYEDAERLIEEGYAGRADLLFAVTSVKDIFFLLPRKLRREDIRAARARGEEGAELSSVSYRPAAWACVERMMELATPSPLGLAECELARMLRDTHGDFEDNLIIASAETADADYIVTYDKELLKCQGDICLTPDQALKYLDRWPKP